jgi:hypothetical protein
MRAVIGMVNVMVLVLALGLGAGLAAYLVVLLFRAR